MFTPQQIAEIVRGRILKGCDARVVRVIHDSRRIEPGDLFIAIKGERTDGHAFLAQAFERGACGAIISDEKAIPENARNLILVDDVIVALHALATAWRRQMSATFVGVTGTCGKTTTRSLLYHLLEGRMSVYSAPGNYNTEIGLPLALLAMPRDAEVGLFELGASAPGDIAPLAALLAPSIGVITLAGRGHLTGFGGVEAVAQEKWDLVRALPPNGAAFVNVDSPPLAALGERYAGNMTTVGIDSGDFRGRVTSSKNGLVVDTHAPRLHLETRLLGKHNTTNILLAAAVAIDLGLSTGEIERRIKTFSAFPHRLNLVPAPFGYILDDSYNANPESTRAALIELARLDVSAKRRAFVFGDMLDLGEGSASFHDEVIELALELGIDPIFPVGDQTTQAAKRSQSAGSFVFCEDRDLAACILSHLPDAKIALLVKGSLAVGLTKIVQELSR
ncbi:UDP-N-acetylmuramoyl-tripeptide--D-alanyl-D-alanine ligase [Candidatus Bipolaricaulota bacterium]|nr:UDP-N-acetylmuramoyl-tripeptide--D-alanyl-D-alanine ligase [Candidatus Bipolaricaulota bacterium]